MPLSDEARKAILWDKLRQVVQHILTETSDNEGEP